MEDKWTRASEGVIEHVGKQMNRRIVGIVRLGENVLQILQTEAANPRTANFLLQNYAILRNTPRTLNRQILSVGNAMQINEMMRNSLGLNYKSAALNPLSYAGVPPTRKPTDCQSVVNVLVDQPLPSGC